MKTPHSVQLEKNIAFRYTMLEQNDIQKDIQSCKGNTK